MVDSLDLKDRRLLLELDTDCRQSNAEIGRKTRLSKEVVKYRIDKLIEKKIINSFSAHIDLTKLGYRMCKIYFQLQKSKSEEQIVEYLLSKKQVFWLASCEGNWNIICGVLLKDVFYFHEFIADVLNKFSDAILKKAISISILIPEFPKSYLVERQNSQLRHNSFGGICGNIVLSENELLLLRVLSMNARLSTTEIAEKTGLSPMQVSYGIKKLKREKIILSFRLNLNYEKLGLLYFKQFVTFRAPTKEKIGSIIEFCRKHPNITYSIFCIGAWDLEIDSEVKNYSEFNALAKEFKEKFSDIILSHESIQISREYKMDFMPESISPYSR
jgi:Lrp/AsnC family leucine-responsive transcriptional regulator